MKNLFLTFKLFVALFFVSFFIASCSFDGTSGVRSGDDAIYRGALTNDMINTVNLFVGDWNKIDDNDYKVTITNFRASEKLIDVSLTRNGNTVNYTNIFINKVNTNNSEVVLANSIFSKLSYSGNKMYFVLPETNVSTAFVKN